MRVKKISKTHSEVKMYGEIGGWFVDGFNFTSMLDDFEASGVEEVTFRMHCYGGSVFEGDVIGGAFARSKMKINIIIDGVSASMGCMILPYVPVENISIAENGFGMIHSPSGGGNGDRGYHLSVAKLLGDIQGNFVKSLSARTGISGDEIKSKFFDGKDHWLNADEMVKYKLAGKKVKSVASIAVLDKQQVEQMTEESIYGHFAAKLDVQNNHKNKVQMKEDLIKSFNLEGLTADSSETAVMAALLAKFQALETKVDNLEAKAKTEKETAIKAALDAAETAGKFKVVAESTGAKEEEIRASYKSIGETSGVDVLNTVLAGIASKTTTTKTTTVIKDLIKNEGGKGGANAGDKDWNWYQENDPKTLEEMPVKDPDTFKALYNKEYGCDPE